MSAYGLWPHHNCTNCLVKDTYTARQKKLITSSERRSLKSTTLKLITFGHIEAKVLMKHILWKIKWMLLSKRRKMRWNRKRSSFKNHRNCSLKTSTKGRLFRTFNSYSFNFNGRFNICNCHTGFVVANFFDFFRNYLLWFHCIFLKQTQAHLCVLDVLDKEYSAYLYPNIIYFSAVDFSERLSEEVMFLLTRSDVSFDTQCTCIHVKYCSLYSIMIPWSHDVSWNTHVVWLTWKAAMNISKRSTWDEQNSCCCSHSDKFYVITIL